MDRYARICLGACVVAVIALVMLYRTEYDHRRSLAGVWVATAEYCANAGISSMALRIDAAPGRLPDGGHIVITRNTSVLCNQSLTFSGWSWRHARQPEFTAKVSMYFEEDPVIPPHVTMIATAGTLSIWGKPITAEDVRASNTNGLVNYGDFVRVAHS